MAGELKLAAPSYENYAFISLINKEGEVQESFSLKSAVQNADDGVRADALLSTADGNLFLGGGYTGNWSPLGLGSERTLTSLNPQGQIRWSQMQSSFYFADLLYDSDAEQIITISGPQDLIDPAYNLEISSFDPDGKALATFSLQSPSQDYGVSLEEINSGFAYAGLSILGGEKRLLIGTIDNNLELRWSKVISQDNFEFSLEDMAYHKEAGILALTGSAFDTKNNVKSTFLLGIAEDGEIRFYQSFIPEQNQNSVGLGLASYSFEGEEGFLLVGAFNAFGEEQRRSFCIKTDLLGDIQWAQNYSDYAPSDNSWDEVLRDVVYREGEKEFLALGDVSRFKNGIELDRKSLVLIRADIREGELADGESCFEGINFTTQSNALQEESLGTGNNMGGGSISFSYQQPSLFIESGYCSFGSVGPEESQSRYRYGTEGFFIDRDAYSLIQEGLSSVMIEWNSLAKRQLSTMEVLDLQGKLLKRIELNPYKSRERIEFSGLSYGMYFVRIRTAGQYLKTDRFILGE
ncbi:MAG: T9SS type A sorting domain-containing protein [Bacteroidota bacterium]